MIRWLALSAALVGLVLGIALPHPARRPSDGQGAGGGLDAAHAL